MRIWLASHPRSGAEIFRVLAFQRWGIHSYNPEQPPGKKEGTPPELNGTLWRDLPTEEGLRLAETGPEPVLVKTHRLPTDSAMAVVMERDPRCSITSHWDFWNRRSPGHQLTLEDFIRGVQPFGPWSAHARAWRRVVSSRDAIVRYADLVAGKTALLQRLDHLVRSWGVDRTPVPWDEAVARIHQLRPGFLHGRITRWAGHPEWGPEHDRLFYRLHGHTFRALGWEPWWTFAVPRRFLRLGRARLRPQPDGRR